MVSALISRLIVLIFGTLYPAYASYKAIRTKNMKEYFKWMMYWVVFALFSCVETFSDIFLAWVPFYYEIKIVFLIWLLSPATRGSSFLFRKFIIPQLSKREEAIDEYLKEMKTRGYKAVLNLGSQVISSTTNVLVNTALKGQHSLADHLRRSYSTSDINRSSVPGYQRSRITYSEDEVLQEEFEEDQLDNRIAEDNDEIEGRTTRMTTREREKKSKTKRPASLERVREIDDDDEEEVVITEELEFIPIKRGSRAHKEIMSNPYGTIPRVRSRKREVNRIVR